MWSEWRKSTEWCMESNIRSSVLSKMKLHLKWPKGPRPQEATSGHIFKGSVKGERYAPPRKWKAFKWSWFSVDYILFEYLFFAPTLPPFASYWSSSSQHSSISSLLCNNGPTWISSAQLQRAINLQDGLLVVIYLWFSLDWEKSLPCLAFVERKVLGSKKFYLANVFLHESFNEWVAWRNRMCVRWVFFNETNGSFLSPLLALDLLWIDSWSHS